jgi:hypothetical protein
MGPVLPARLAAGGVQAVMNAMPVSSNSSTRRERPEVLVATFGVHTSDAGHALAVVAAGEEAGGHTGDALEAETAEIFRVA